MWAKNWLLGLFRGPLALVGWALALFKPILWIIGRLGDLDVIEEYWPMVARFMEGPGGTTVTVLGGLLLLAYSAYRTATHPTVQGAYQPQQTPMQLQTFDLEGPNYDAWDNVRLFTLHEAAHLWADEDPNVPYASGTYRGYLTMLRQAIIAGSLQADLNLHQSMMFRRDPDMATQMNIKVKRDNLKKYAKSINQKPEFLFRNEKEEHKR